MKFLAWPEVPFFLILPMIADVVEFQSSIWVFYVSENRGVKKSFDLHSLFCRTESFDRHVDQPIRSLRPGTTSQSFRCFARLESLAIELHLLRKHPIMSIDRRKVALFGAAAAVRLLLFTFPGLPDLLTGRVEISTPVTSFKRCENSSFAHAFSS